MCFVPDPRLLWIVPLTLLLVACPRNGNDKGDGGDNDGAVVGDGGNADGGADAGPWLCASDWECDLLEICDEGTGVCQAGNPCNPQLGYANCNFPNPGDGCLGDDDSQACVCDPDDPADPNPSTGICKERRITCEPCVNPTECGDLPIYDDEASCVDYAGETVCLPESGRRGCPSGYEPNITTGYCEPAGGDCASVFTCIADSDCPSSRPVCNLVTGTCTKGCVFDLKTGDSSCPSGKVCDQDGKCRDPCDPANDTCADIDPTFICREDTGGVFRCRIDGCIATLECEVPAASPYVGYCDLTDNTCVTDRCRPERTDGQGFNEDCKLPHRCDATNNTCVPMTCVERGGAALACEVNQICCGECRNVTDNGARDDCDPMPCTGGEIAADSPALDGCVHATNPPWCATCADENDCLTNNPKEDARDTNQCSQNLCLNTCETARDCPTRWQCSYLFAGCDPASANQCGTAGVCVDDGSYGIACNSAGDCDQNANETCSQDPTDGQMKCHRAFNVCDCAPDGSKDDADCPPDTRCAATGFQIFRCVSSKVCLPGQDICP